MLGLQQHQPPGKHPHHLRRPLLLPGLAYGSSGHNYAHNYGYRLHYYPTISLPVPDRYRDRLTIVASPVTTYSSTLRRLFIENSPTFRELSEYPERTINRNAGLGRITRTAVAAVPYDDFAVWSYLLDGDIAYLGFNAFSITANFDDPDVAATMNNFYSIINDTPNLRGIIIDTRNNGGGSTRGDMFRVVSPLLSPRSRPVLFGYTRTKSGLARLDYTPWSPLSISAPDPAEDLVSRDVSDIPIVALADIHSVSMAEITPMAILAMPNGTLVGERTNGGHGPLNSNINEFYAGELENDAFRMYTSTSMTRRADHRCYEGVGISPSIHAPFDPDRFYAGEDTQLDRAAAFIHSGR